MSKLKVMTIFGTRPEAVKLGPLIKELEKLPDRFESYVCVTAQHREMLDQVLRVLNIVPQFDLDIMTPNQTLQEVTIKILSRINAVFDEVCPDIILVHGDTITTFLASFAAFLRKIKVGHVEAGLRTGNKYSPFPEEINRQLVGVLADLHFAPTVLAANNLIKENKPQDSIFITGNTAIDMFPYTIDEKFQHPVLDWANGRKLILMSAHRRESQGEPHRNIFSAIRKIAEEFSDIAIVYPVHPSPAVKEMAFEIP